jgi:GTP cyclohydrolase II
MDKDILDFILDKQTSLLDEGPQITLSYAQSIDGSLALARGHPLPISGPEALVLTHQLRAIHDGILVGIGTVLSDDPRLTVRDLEGPSPQAIILDSQLRMPVEAKLLKQAKGPWIFCLEKHDEAKKKKLEQLGASVVPIAANEDGRVDLELFTEKAASLSLKRIMLEGGASLISSFLSAKLVNMVVVTIAPMFIGGLKALEIPLSIMESESFPRILNPRVKQLGNDLILWGDMERE